VQIDPDGVLRRFPNDPRLSRLGLGALPARLAGVELKRDVAIEFPSETRPIPTVSYYDVWRGAEGLDRSLGGKIAFVGSVLDESVDYVSVPRMQRLDGNRKGFVLPGVTALAATTETLLRGAPIRDASWPVTLLWNLFWCVTAVSVMPRRKPIRGAVLFGAILVLAVIVTGLLHAFGGLVFPAGLLVGCLVFFGGYALVAAHVEAETTIVLEEAEIQRVRKELETARDAQKRFLPKTIPTVEGYDLWGINISSREVSGDYFDMIDLGAEAPLIFAIADVSGKGLPAALVMSNVQAALHSHVLQGGFDLARTTRNLNTLVCENTDEETFVTMFIGELWKKTGVFRYVRAGHEMPFVVTRDASVRRLEKGGLVLGFLPDIDYEIGEEMLEDGDLVCLYTDGVTEARNTGGEEFQTDRLMEVLIGSRDEKAKDIVQLIVQKVRDFTGLEHEADDVTVVILKVGQSEPRL
jgi:serine phosphatase RsbU (regulator of sigma subunit)